MTKKIKAETSEDISEGASLQARLPGFINEQEIGLGDVIKRTSSYLGVRLCEGCESRTNTLNRWLVFTNRRSN